MRIQLLQDHAIHVKTLKAATQLKCTNELGRELISEGIAVEIDTYTFEEIDVVNKAIAEIETTDKKKHKPKKKKTENLKNESDSEVELD